MVWLHDIRVSRRPLAALVGIGFAWGAFSASVPPIKAQIGASDAVYGWLVLLASLGALAAMWVAPAAFRLAGRWALALGMALIGAGFLLAAQAEGPLLFVCGMLMAAGGSGIADVLANAEIADCEAETGRALMNLNHGLYSFAFAGAALVAGVLREGAWTPPGIMGVLALSIAALVALMWAPRPASAPETAQPKGRLPSVVWLGGLVVLAAFLAEAGTEGWSALHLERTLGGSAQEGALGPAFFGVMMGIGRLFGHVLASRAPDMLVMRTACLVAASGLALAGIAPRLEVAFAGFALAGLGISVVVPMALALVGRSVAASRRLAAISRAAALGYAAFFLGPPAMGGLAQLFGLRAAFWGVAAVLVCVAVVLMPMLGRAVAQAARDRGLRGDR